MARQLFKQEIYKAANDDKQIRKIREVYRPDMKLLMENWRKYLGLAKEEPEPEEELEPEEEEEDLSQEAKLAMLLMHGEEDQATMMFEMLVQIDEVNLDLLATEIDDGLRAEWEALPPVTKTFGLGRVPTPEELAQALKYSDAWRAWIPKLGAAVRFVTGGDKTQGFRPTASVYKLGSLKDTLARHLRMTVHKMKNPSEDTSDEDLMENWRQYMKDNPHLDELPLGADTGPLAEPGRETYKFKSREDMNDYTQWKNKGKLHKLNITWEDLLHAMFIGGRKLADYADESAADWEARRAKEAEESDETPT